MKQKSEQTQKFFYGLSAAGIALLAVAMAALCAVALCYAVAIIIAWDSVMAFFILLGLSLIGAGLFVISVAGFFAFMRRVWYDRWPDAPGAKFFLAFGSQDVKSASEQSDVDSADTAAEKEEKKSATSLGKLFARRNSDGSSVIYKPKFLTLQNIGYGILLLAVVCVVVSAALGSLDSDNWVEARRAYMESHGYYAESAPVKLGFSPNEVTEINVYAPDRKVVVVYDSSFSEIVLEYYELYSGEYSVSKSAVSQDIYVLNITRISEPAHDDPIDVMLDLCFQPNSIEEQVLITIPAAYRDKITINGDNIIYAKD